MTFQTSQFYVLGSRVEFNTAQKFGRMLEQLLEIFQISPTLKNCPT